MRGTFFLSAIGCAALTCVAALTAQAPHDALGDRGLLAQDPLLRRSR